MRECENKTHNMKITQNFLGSKYKEKSLNLLVMLQKCNSLVS